MWLQPPQLLIKLQLNKQPDSRCAGMAITCSCRCPFGFVLPGSDSQHTLARSPALPLKMHKPWFCWGFFAGLFLP